MLIIILCLSFLGLILGILGFLYQVKVINKLVKKEQPIDTKEKENKRVLKQNIIGAGSMLLGSIFILIALILSVLPNKF
jgi:hypothetical protein